MPKIQSSSDLLAWADHPVSAASLVAGQAFTFAGIIPLADTPRRFPRLVVSR